jgi:TolB protein
MVHRDNGQFHIASQNLITKDFRVLTGTFLDESPTVAPNGAMLLYATKRGGKGLLAAVSIDAGVKFFLPAREGDVREPAWSPFL